MPVTAFGLFGLSQRGTIGRPSRLEGWIELGKSLVRGDLAAEAAGIAAMVEPTRDQLTELLSAIEPLDTVIERDELALVAAQRELGTIRAAVEDLLGRTGRYMRFSLSGETALKRRRIMRVYGFLFTAEPNDQPEPATESVETD